MTKIKSTIACNLDTNILLSAIPLFENAEIEAIEWSFDALFKVRNIPKWFGELLDEFSQSNRLIGHGVFFSIFSGRWTDDQERWLKHLKKVSNNYQFEHISEHFGFMTGENFHKGAPISVPLTKQTLAIGQDRLKRIHQACACPVGLENLAFAYSMEEVKKQGDFLEQLISPINGFIILDLHNLYCQIHNFEVSFEDIIKLFPLARVKEIHISGGSWDSSQVDELKTVRRDTHDDSVPEKVFEFLEKTIPQCPNLDYVVLEQIGPALKSEDEKIKFQNDFRRMKSIIAKNQKSTIENNFMPTQTFELGVPVQEESLHLDQMEMSSILEQSNTLEEANKKLSLSRLANSAWNIEQWNPVMVETAYKISQKWKEGY